MTGVGISYSHNVSAKTQIATFSNFIARRTYAPCVRFAKPIGQVTAQPDSYMISYGVLHMYGIPTMYSKHL